MSNVARVATTAAELVEAVQSAENTAIEIRGRIENAPSLRLKPGLKLSGTSGAFIGFEPGCDGLVLTSDNTVEGIEFRTDPGRSALSNDIDVIGFGRLTLQHLRTTGDVRLIAANAATGGHVDARDVHVLDADARGFEERPAAFGVEVIPGAFTLWNRQTSPDHLVSAELRGIAAGRAGLPVRGTGILVGGNAGGGRMIISLLETGEVYSDGGIAPVTADRIGGGVFVLQGTEIDEVRNLGPVTTFGANDMVLDNWGQVERWHALGKVSSYGAAGIGFVNLGALGTLALDSLLETHGLGACGFNCGEFKENAGETVPAARGGTQTYDGIVREAIFERVVTRGDGAVGIQVAVPIGRMLVRSGIETFGGGGRVPRPRRSHATPRRRPQHQARRRDARADHQRRPDDARQGNRGTRTARADRRGADLRGGRTKGRWFLDCPHRPIRCLSGHRESMATASGIDGRLRCPIQCVQS